MKRVTPLFLSVLMAFFGVPILAQCVALCGGIVVFIIASLADALGIDGPLKDHFSTLSLMLTSVMMFACGRLWARESQSETCVEWRHCCLILPAILALICWVFTLQQAGLEFTQVKVNWLSTVLIAPWMGAYIVALLNQWYWDILLLPVCSQVCFALGYGGKQWFSLRVKSRAICLGILTLGAAAAAYQAWHQAQKFPPTLYENLNRRDFDPRKWRNKLTQIQGAYLVYTPFAREAFVFVVNKYNPVTTLSDAQIRAIYSGKITQWREVGGDTNPIQAWQRPEDSGSQTAIWQLMASRQRLVEDVGYVPLIKPVE